MMPWWKNTRSVRGPLLMAVGLILVVGFMITNGVSYYISKESLRKALIENELPLTSNNIYSEIQRDILQPVFVASMIANDTFVKDWLLDGERSIAEVTRYLDEIRRKYGLFTSFIVSEKTRNYYHFSGLSQVVSEADPADKWYFRSRSMKEDYELNVDLNPEQGGVMTIFINYKVLGYDNELLAVAGVGLNFEAISNVVDRYKENFGRNVYFVDPEGNISVRSGGGAITEDNIFKSPGISEFADQVISEEQGFYEYDRDGETMLLNTRYIPELGWHVMVEQHESEALAAVRNVFISNTFVGIGIIAFIILIISYTVNLFHSRLETMLADAERAHLKMEALAESESALNVDLQYQIDVKNRFFSIISHDLIGPFQGLLGMTRLLSTIAGTDSREKLSSYADDVNVSASRVFELLRNLLEWSRLQIEGHTLKPEMIKLNDLVQESLEVLEPIAKEKNIQLTSTIEDTSVYADSEIVSIVVRNLISNSLKFTPAGGRIIISSNVNEGVVKVTITDTGVGVSMEDAEKLFSLDVRTTKIGTAGETGTGLGLPLCKDLLEKSRGNIWVESRLSEGSKFHFTLPAEPESS